jgi:hypothetical protein
MRTPFLAVILAASALVPAYAATPVARDMTCPIGGGAFKFAPPASYSTSGTRPDGKPIGQSAFPLPLPECPDNGLVLYKEYSPDEVAKLEPLIASDEYKAMRGADTQYYRAYWLMKAMGVDAEDYLWVLLQASWEAESKPELRQRYLTELAETSAAVAPKLDDLNWVGMEARAVNALRELGRFDEALARLDQISLVPLDVRLPPGQPSDPAVQQARQKRAWLAFLKELRPAIERKDASVEPLDLLPRGVALDRCIDDAAGLSEHGKTWCEGQTAALAQLRTAREQLAREAAALRQSREASGR